VTYLNYAFEIFQSLTGIPRYFIGKENNLELKIPLLAIAHVPLNPQYTPHFLSKLIFMTDIAT
jgi:hypothetical protein